jgi:hypothetical protein
MTYKKNRESTNCNDCVVPEWAFCGSTNFELVNGKCEFISAPDTKPSLYSRPNVNTCAPRTFLGIPMSSLLGCDRLRPECGADLELDHAGLQCAATPCPNDGLRYPDGICRQQCLRGEVRDDDGVCRDWYQPNFKKMSPLGLHDGPEGPSKTARGENSNQSDRDSAVMTCPEGSFYDQEKEECVPKQASVRKCPKGSFYHQGKEHCLPGKKIGKRGQFLKNFKS